MSLFPCVLLLLQNSSIFHNIFVSREDRKHLIFCCIDLSGQKLSLVLYFSPCSMIVWPVWRGILCFGLGRVAQEEIVETSMVWGNVGGLQVENPWFPFLCLYWRLLTKRVTKSGWFALPFLSERHKGKACWWRQKSLTSKPAHQLFY